MTEILALIQAFLDRANRETVGISDQILDEFAAACRQLMVRQFNERPPSFTLRFSNIGRSTCQLQMEASGASGDTLSYAHKMKMLIGDLTEAATIAVMKAAGVPVEEVSKPVSLAFEVTKPDGTSDVVRIQGTYDVMINNVVYDIKSASPYAFQNKFDNPNGYERLKADDSFGYLTQGYGYAVAAGKRFGGWIVVEKSTGEIAVLETPEDAEKYEADKEAALQKAVHNIQTLVYNAPFARSFTDEEETFYKKPTGNRILGYHCTFCAYKDTCWPGVVRRPQIHSKGLNPKMMYYTYVSPDADQTRVGQSEGESPTAMDG